MVVSTYKNNFAPFTYVYLQKFLPLPGAGSGEGARREARAWPRVPHPLRCQQKYRYVTTPRIYCASYLACKSANAGLDGQLSFTSDNTKPRNLHEVGKLTK